MAARASVAIRLGTEGKAQVRQDFREIASDGDATANRWARSFERAGQDVEAAMRRQQLAAEKLAQITPATPMQRQVQAAASTSYTGGSAQESARFFAEQAAATAQLEARTRALLASIDPVWVAQQRFNREMAEARALISAGAITLDQYVAKLGQERAALEAATRAGGRHVASQGQMRAGSQQLAYSIGDFATQVSMGQGILMAFSAQMNQTVSAIAMMQKESKGFIGFMGGPWGAGIQGGILLLGMLAGKYLDGSEAAQEKERAAKALTDQMDRLYESNMRAVKSEQRLQQEALNTAVAMWKKAEATRLATVEAIKEERAKLVAAQATQRSPGGSVPGSMFSIGVGQEANARERLKQLDAELAANSKRVSEQWQSIQAARIPILQGIASESDRATASTRAFDRSVDALNKRMIDGKISAAAYTREYARLKAGHEAEQKVISESDRKVRGKSEADRAGARAAREAARDARDYARDLQSLQDRYDPLTAATRRYREELEKIEALRGDDAASAGLFQQGAADAYLKERASILGDAIGIESIRGEGSGEEDRSQRFEQRKRDLAESITFAQREFELVAANDNMRARELSRLQLILDLKRDLPDLTEQETAALIAQHEQLMDIADATAKARGDWEHWRDFASNTLDVIFDPNNWEDWGDLGERVLKDLAKEFVMLAALNPLKNMMFGTDLPTMGGFFDTIGSLFNGGIPGFGSIKFATGTYHAPGGVALVGENGPELVSLPRGSQVKGTSATRQALGGMGGTSVNIDASIHAPGADAAALARVEEHQRQMMAEFPRIALEAVADAQQRMRRPLGLTA